MKSNFLILFAFLIITGVSKMSAQINNGKMEFEFEVNASPSEAYNAWTTVEGLQSFFAAKCEVELKLFGDYHIYFFPDNEPGSRGAEDEKIIAFEKDKMISFTWGFPPSLMDLRNNQKTIVNIRFTDLGNGKTKINFVNTGWGSGEDWQKGYEYFINAWGNFVLARLQYRFEHGAIDWNNPPNYIMYALSKTP